MPRAGLGLGGSAPQWQPQRRGKRPRLVSPRPLPASRRRPQRGAERDRRGGSPLSSAQEACGVQAEETARGSGTAWGAGAGHVSLLVVELGVCHSPPRPGQGHVPRSPGRELPGEVGLKSWAQAPWQPGPPCGTCPWVSGADRSGQPGRGWGGRSCQSPVSPAGSEHLPLHAACRGPCPL